MSEIASTAAPLSRRELIVGLGVVGTVIAAGGVSAGVAEADEPAEVVRDDVRYGFLIDTDNCVNCKKCVEACRASHDTPEDMPSRRKVTPYANSID